jgi:hypothetical protein
VEPNEQPTGRAVAELAGARLPADRGLASLALLMQLVGTVGVIFWCLISLMIALAGGGHAMLGFFAAITCILRSGFHRGAGSAMLYGAGPPSRAITLYVVISIIHSVAILGLLTKLDPPIELLLQYGGLLLAWPVALAVLLMMPRYKRMLDHPLPIAEDLGYEGMSALMVVFGAAGASIPILGLWLIVDTPGVSLASPPFLITAGLFLLFLVRSGLQIRAGLRGLRGQHDESVTGQYTSIGIASSLIAGVVVLIVALVAGSLFTGLVLGTVIASLLLVWPLTIRRFTIERMFGLALAGEQAPVPQRAPDRGLTAVGWLLLASGLVGLAGSLPIGIFGDADLAETIAAVRTYLGDDAAATIRSDWWGIGVNALQLWAGIELVRMSDHHRIAGNIYGTIAIAVSIYVHYPLIKMASEAIGGFGGGEAWSIRVSLLVGLALNMLVPLATVILVNRRPPDGAVAVAQRGHQHA